MPSKNLGKRNTGKSRKLRIPLQLPTEDSFFNELSKKVIIRARQEAVRLGHAHIGSEHLLLGLLAERKSAGVKILEGLKIKPSELRRVVMEMIHPGKIVTTDPASLQYTERTRRVFADAMYQARFLGAESRRPGTEFLLYGLVRTKDGIAEQALTKLLGEKAEYKIWKSILSLDNLYAH